ncbi:uncharacterized protein BDW47DRAFT_100486 [Aspergillus candidus]|uniref:Uncharacterized protein n=1 Tax=Aspergillus candidus TaxID=41067 RepID=A0A2I2FKG1_ASPCN|nr:hypothetical protein BDW47DRAFT_100486 [Aspergillus candidus]PLB41094.1 hypothetical protein BDW47DRAFT_100486 [Aspergillus candidus]
MIADDLDKGYSLSYFDQGINRQAITMRPFHDSVHATASSSSSSSSSTTASSRDDIPTDSIPTQSESQPDSTSCFRLNTRTTEEQPSLVPRLAYRFNSSKLGQ